MKSYEMVVVQHHASPQH